MGAVVLEAMVESTAPLRWRRHPPDRIRRQRPTASQHGSSICQAIQTRRKFWRKPAIQRQLVRADTSVSPGRRSRSRPPARRPRGERPARHGRHAGLGGPAVPPSCAAFLRRTPSRSASCGRHGGLGADSAVEQRPDHLRGVPYAVAPRPTAVPQASPGTYAPVEPGAITTAAALTKRRVGPGPPDAPPASPPRQARKNPAMPDGLAYGRQGPRATPGPCPVSRGCGGPGGRPIRGPWRCVCGRPRRWPGPTGGRRRRGGVRRGSLRAAGLCGGARRRPGR
jgi:hypothetical protein